MRRARMYPASIGTISDQARYNLVDMLKDEMEGKVPPDLMNGDAGNDMDDDGNDGIHMHVHLPNGSNGGGNGEAKPMMEDQGEPDLPGGDIADLAARLAALEQKVAELMDGDEGEVELQNPGDAKDAKRYIMRRGSRLKAHDEEEIPVPERLKDMIGETDLPGVEDLDARTEKTGTGDSVPQELLWQETMTKGEIIVPGIRIPTFDSRVKPTTTAQRLCSFRRQTLDAALEIEESRDVLAGLVGIKTKDQVKTLACDTLKMAFEATANALANNRNNGIVRSSVADSLPGYRPNPRGGAASLGEIQRRNREAWKTGEFKPIH